jgi:hypothetical protein
MELIITHIIRFGILMLGIAFAVIIGRYRPEWKSRKTLISWVWTIAAIDIMIMDGAFATTLSAQLFIGGALILNVINFIGDRIETIKFKDFSASLGHEETNEQGHSMRKEPTPTPPKKNETPPPQWPDGDEPEQK